MDSKIQEFDEELRLLLRRKAAWAELGHMDLDAGVRRGRRRMARNATAAVVSVALLVYGALAGLAAIDRAGQLRPAQTPRNLPARVVARISVPVNSISLAVGDGAVWVASAGYRALTSGEVRAAPTLDTNPTLSLVDLATNQVAPGVQLGSYGSRKPIVIAFGSVWLLDEYGGAILRLDPVTGSLQARIEHVPGITHAVAGEGSLWAFAEGDILRIDPDTNQVMSRLDLRGRTGYQLGFDDCHCWEESRPPWRVGGDLGRAVADPKQLEIVARRPTTVELIEEFTFAGGATWAYAYGEGDPWPSNLLRLDPMTGEVTRAIRVAGAITAIQGDGDDLWVAAGEGSFSPAPDGWSAGSRILRVDARTGEVLATFHVDVAKFLNALAVDGDTLWALASENELLRIGLGTV
jgi:hypothetical protein